MLRSFSHSVLNPNGPRSALTPYLLSDVERGRKGSFVARLVLLFLTVLTGLFSLPMRASSVRNFLDSPISSRVTVSASSTSSPGKKKISFARPERNAPVGVSMSNRVLKYLERMSRYCRMRHRQDLVKEYDEAWDIVAECTLGRLPARLPSSISFHYEAEVKAPTFYQLQSRQRPARKVIGKVDGYLLLECGHRTIDVGLGEKSKRCRDCHTTPPKSTTGQRADGTVPASSEARRSAYGTVRASGAGRKVRA